MKIYIFFLILRVDVPIHQYNKKKSLSGRIWNIYFFKLFEDTKILLRVLIFPTYFWGGCYYMPVIIKNLCQKGCEILKKINKWQINIW